MPESEQIIGIARLARALRRTHVLMSYGYEVETDFARWLEVVESNAQIEEWFGGVPGYMLEELDAADAAASAWAVEVNWRESDEVKLARNRLAVVVPPESLTDPEWYPAHESFDIERTWDIESGTGAPFQHRFRWPARRLFLSRSAAARRAKQMRLWGAEVTVEKSEVVTWTDE